MFVEHKEAGEVTETLSEAARRLLKAAELMENQGHCRGEANGKDGSLCVVAAITYADIACGGSGAGPSYSDAARLLCTFLRTTMIVEWSDASPTKEVIGALRSAALGA